MSNTSSVRINRFIGKYGKFYKALANIVSAFIPSKMIRPMVRRYIQFGENNWNSYWAVKKYQNYKDFKYNLSLVACLKNEADYIEEWLEYYKLMGVEHFYLYNNNSTDNIHEIIKPYVDAGLVTFIDYPGNDKQIEIYNHALKTFRLETKWLIVVDLDEFILPKRHATIKEFLDSYDNVDTVIIEWCMYGDSHHTEKPEGLVIENFLYRDSRGWGETKSITKPNKTYFIEVHRPHAKNRIVMPIEEIQCNHYFTKSYEEYWKKKSARKDNSGIDKYNSDIYDFHNKNEVYDDSMLVYAKKIKEILGKK